MTDVQQLVRLLFNNNFVNPVLVLQTFLHGDKGPWDKNQTLNEGRAPIL